MILVRWMFLDVHIAPTKLSRVLYLTWLFFCLLGGLFSSSSPAMAALFFSVENPTHLQQVSGISLVSGWAFSSLSATPIRIALRVDGQSVAETIPCCTRRADVVAVFGPGTPIDAGFGLLVNYSSLTAGPHIFSIVISAAGEETATVERQVTVVKPGDVDFVSSFGLAGANAGIDGDELILAGVRIGVDDAPPRSTLRVNYATSSQSLVIGQASSANPTLYDKVQGVFSNCTFSGGCHGSDNPQAELRLSSGASFTNLVAVRSTEVPTLFRVNPGKPEESYLLQKIEQTNPQVGGQMPLGGPPLAAEHIDTIRQWILASAPPPF